MQNKYRIFFKPQHLLFVCQNPHPTQTWWQTFTGFWPGMYGQMQDIHQMETPPSYMHILCPLSAILGAGEKKTV